MLAIFQHLTKVGYCLLTGSHLKAVPNESDALVNDTPTSSPSPLAEMAMNGLSHFSAVTP